MDALTKVKLFYSGELLVFAIVFLVIAILKFAEVIKGNSTRQAIFNWVTIFGGTWIIVDFFWALFSKKRRSRIALIDKIIHLPAGIYLVAFDIFCFATKPAADSAVYHYGIPAVIMYLFVCYTFEAIYHFFYPVPGLLDAVVEVPEEENKEEISSLEEKPQELQPEEEKQDEEKR